MSSFISRIGDFFKGKEDVKNEIDEIEEMEMTSENLFKNKEYKITSNCENCVMKNKCKKVGNPSINCEYVVDMDWFDFEKDTLLLIDDNAGVVSFLENDINYLDEIGSIKKEDINILSLSGNFAPFTLNVLYKKLEKLNIKWAIIDITLGSRKMTPDGIKTYTGVDVLEMINKNEKSFNYLFFTGNNLNPHIKANEILINQFKEFMDTDIMDKIVMKTSKDMKSRRKFFKENLFKG